MTWGSTKEELAETRKQWAIERKQIHNKIYQQKNKSKLRANRDLGKSAARSKEYQAKKNGTVISDKHKDVIMRIYEDSNRLNDIFGRGTFQVDHTVPISKAGEHHPGNLQIVPASWNMNKGNKHTNRWETPFSA